MSQGSEASLVGLALAPLEGRTDVSVLCAADGALPPLLASPLVQRIDLIGPAPAAASDPRVKAHALDLSLLLKQARLGAVEGPAGGWFAVIVDARVGELDDGWVERLEAALRPGGVLTVRTGRRDLDLLKRLHARLQAVAEVALPADGEGEAALDYVYRARRPAPPADPSRAN
jgi:hypothetical protein